MTEWIASIAFIVTVYLDWILVGIGIVVMTRIMIQFVVAHWGLRQIVKAIRG